MLPGPTTLRLFFLDPFGTTDPTDACIPLLVSGQRIHPGEAMAAFARVRLDSRMDLLVPFQVVLPYKPLVAMHAEKLSVTKVSLNVGLDVLLPTEPLSAFWIHAYPFLIFVWTTDECTHFLGGNASVNSNEP